MRPAVNCPLSRRWRIRGATSRSGATAASLTVAFWHALQLDHCLTMEAVRQHWSAWEAFLERLITDNTITFGDDKVNRHWTIGYYLAGC